MSRTAESPLRSEMCASHCERSTSARRDIQLRDHGADIAGDGGVDLDVLVELRRVDVDVNLLGVRRVGLEVAGDTIVEAHAERDQQIGFLNGGIHPGFAVHAHHAEVQRVRRRETADAEQRHRHRNLRLLGERLERPLPRRRG